MRLRRITSTIIIEIRKEIPVDYVVDLDEVDDSTASLNSQVNCYRTILGDPQHYGAGTITTTIPLSLIEGAEARVYTGGYSSELVNA